MTKKDRLFHQKTKKNDLILLIILLLICAVSGAGYYFTHRTPALRAEVSIDGEIVQVLDSITCLPNLMFVWIIGEE